ncbi:MAG: 50S ribosomal protein L13 [Candidatus Pacebacteria bacterium]|nr:50S ribosomal protein L13 [Candidatus Paceibacterota bacterium]
MENTERKTHTIDATGKSLGRLATKIVDLLRGKTKVGFAPYKDDGDFVVVENISRMAITGKKKKQKIYFHFTGFIGGMKETTMEKLIEKKGVGEVLKKAVAGMLPKNKLKPGILKRLTIK